MKIRKSGLVLLCAGIAAAAPAKADTRSDVLSGIQRCGVIRDDRTWLECLYGADQPMRAQLGLPPAPEFQQRLVPPFQPGLTAPVARSMPAPAVRSTPAPVPRKKPGFLDTLLGTAPAVASSRMASYRYEKNGAFVVTLENGQQWRQTDVEGGAVSWTKSPSEYLVTVTPGAFSTYNLRTDDNLHAYKVEPVK
ncbi:MAG TPA: hypothetical protein VK515_03560 [Rhizomicrobium sp.]|nr:hypothetical protein [Rhizomicrobium sp.]